MYFFTLVLDPLKDASPQSISSSQMGQVCLYASSSFCPHSFTLSCDVKHAQLLPNKSRASGRVCCICREVILMYGSIIYSRLLA